MPKTEQQQLSKKDRLQLARAAAVAIRGGLLNHRFADDRAKAAVLADLHAFINNKKGEFDRMLVEGLDGRWRLKTAADDDRNGNAVTVPNNAAQQADPTVAADRTKSDRIKSSRSRIGGPPIDPTAAAQQDDPIDRIKMSRSIGSANKDQANLARSLEHDGNANAVSVSQPTSEVA